MKIIPKTLADVVHVSVLGKANFGHIKSLFFGGRQRNVQRITTYVQSHCPVLLSESFCSPNDDITINIKIYLK